MTTGRINQVARPRSDLRGAAAPAARAHPSVAPAPSGEGGEKLQDGPGRDGREPTTGGASLVTVRKGSEERLRRGPTPPESHGAPHPQSLEGPRAPAEHGRPLAAGRGRSRTARSAAPPCREAGRASGAGGPNVLPRVTGIWHRQHGGAPGPRTVFGANTG